MTGQLLDLISRSDDAAIRFETTRVFVNIVTSLASVSRDDLGKTLNRLVDESVISVFIRLLQDARQYPVLVNEAIIALSLLAAFGPSGTCKFAF